MTRIPLLVICCLSLFVPIAEILCGTDPYFAIAVGVIFVAAGITYNLLGGVTNISGILFAEFALRSVIISQFAKIYFREPADLNVEVPHLTVTLYVVFFCSLALSSLFFGRLKLSLPRPVEPQTESQTRLLYWISLAGGVIGTYMYDAQQLSSQSAHLAHSIGLALMNLLYFAMLLAIDETIRKTGRRHSIGWTFLVPFSVLFASSLLTTSRGPIAAMIVLYAFVCYTRGYRFRNRHLLGGLAFVLFFVFVFSPLELYNRRDFSTLEFSDRVAGAVDTLEQPPKYKSFAATDDENTAYEGRHGYLNGTQNGPLNRLAMISLDSALISACSSGFHYGWTSLKLDLVYAIPRFINPNKPMYDASFYVGLVSGMNQDPSRDEFIAFSAIADSFAGFGFAGVIVLGLFIVPLFLAVYRNIFDLRTVWGVVALGVAATTFGEWRTGQYLVNTIYLPIYIIGLSWVLNAVCQLVPTRGEPELLPSPVALVHD